MASLAKLVGRVLQLPADGFRLGVPEAAREQEMALLESIIPTTQVLAWRRRGVEIRRACFIQNDLPDIRYQVVNGRAHTIVAKLSVLGLSVTDSGERLDIDTVEQLRQYISLIADSHENGTN